MLFVSTDLDRVAGNRPVYLTRVDGHADPQRGRPAPLRREEGLLPGQGGDERRRRRGEGRAQPVPGVTEDMTAGGLHRLAEQLVVPAEVAGHGVLVAFPTPGAGLDVGEEEGLGFCRVASDGRLRG